MAQRDAADRLRRLAGPIVVAAFLAGVGLVVALTGAAGPAPSVWARALALGAAVLLVGLGSLAPLGADASVRLIGASAAVWLAGEVVAVWLSVADQSGRAAAAVPVDDFLAAWSARPGALIAVACASGVAVWAAATLVGRVDGAPVVVAGLAGLGLVAGAVGGHAGAHALAPIVVGVHAVAAAWWCGTLMALGLSVRGRAGWARALPRFSDWALWAVAALAVSGVVAAAITLDVFGAAGVSVLWSSGYGRVVVAKALALIGLIALAAWHRRRWVPVVERHRGSAEDSVKRAAVEVVLMAVALGLAAGLAGTAPPG
ncbi:MAG: CopD family protein [Gordonia sp. (in: high G+C Gram-positive bacteria)]|uniref:CopD family protein n=1 Tax=Gordonia sp. (in: high G+C Gram-positive bacteria) TaxID=84139 RepID=UPI0039E5A1FB